MKKIVFLLLAIHFSNSILSQKEKTKTNYWFSELKESEGKVDKNGLKTGDWKYWDIDGNLCAQKTFKNDTLNGVTKIKKAVTVASNYKINEIKNNTSKYEKAIKRQASQKLDTIIQMVNYKNGLKEGIETNYHKNGKIESEVNYTAGNAIGLTKVYDKNGKLTLMKYKNLKDVDSALNFFTDKEYDVTKWYKKDFGSECYFYSNKKIIKSANRIFVGETLKVAKCDWENNSPIKCDTLVYDLNIYDEFGRVKGDNSIIVDIPKKEEEIKVDEIFDVVEEQPQYPGGLDALAEFIKTNYNVDKSKIKTPKEGKIYVSMVIQKDGSIDDIKVLRGLGSPYDDEAIRVVKMMPNWTPGKQRDKVVKVRFNLPFVVSNN